MKTSVWIVITVVVFFLGFLSGYSFAPPPQSGGAASAANAERGH
jgi:hypothetical protein